MTTTTTNDYYYGGRGVLGGNEISRGHHQGEGYGGGGGLRGVINEAAAAWTPRLKWLVQEWEWVVLSSYHLNFLIE